MNTDVIPFNRPFITNTDIEYICSACSSSRLAGDGPFTKRAHTLLETTTGTHKALLTHSCTAALEMSALLLDMVPGDEVIMPSFTFVSTANAFVLRGAVPVFVDIRPDTLNIDERKLEAAITSRTRAIVPVHYAGTSCEMDTIMEVAARHDLAVVEDAAQGYMARYKGRALGTIGHLGAYSFHETKNVVAGEGGALLINSPEYRLRAEITREKGTDRSRFLRGEVDKYTWQDVGSSFLPSDMTAALLLSQLDHAEKITAQRLAIWEYYHQRLAKAEEYGLLRRPVIPAGCEHNAHMYYVLLAPDFDRNVILANLKAEGIHATFHYVPLHDSPAGKRFTRCHGPMTHTNDLSARLVRLPLWVDLTEAMQERVCTALEACLASSPRRHAV